MSGSVALTQDSECANQQPPLPLRAEGRRRSEEKNEGRTMPRYEFMCEKCHKPFELIMTLSEREKGEVKCPKCQGSKVVPQLSGFVAQTSKKS
jgi:putative FmdB family regulatory protein